jgi:O-antigen ligase
MLPMLVALTLNKHRSQLQSLPAQLKLLQGRLPLLTGASLALGVLFILKAQYSIAIYLGAISVAAMIVSRRRALVVLLIAIPLVVVALQEKTMVGTLELAQSVTQDTNVGRKIDDILTSLQSDYAVGSLGDRLERYTRSLQLFANAPIFGVLEFADVGKHSSYLDRFARYGLVGGAVFMYLLLYVPVRMMKRMHAGFGMAFSVFVIALLFPTLNTVFMGFGTALFIMFPVVCSYFTGPGSERLGVATPRPGPGFFQARRRMVSQRPQRP